MVTPGSEGLVVLRCKFLVPRLREARCRIRATRASSGGLWTISAAPFWVLRLIPCRTQKLSLSRPMVVRKRESRSWGQACEEPIAYSPLGAGVIGRRV